MLLSLRKRGRSGLLSSCSLTLPAPTSSYPPQRLLSHAPLAVDKPRYTDPHTKVNALVQVGARQEQRLLRWSRWICVLLVVADRFFSQ